MGKIAAFIMFILTLLTTILLLKEERV